MARPRRGGPASLPFGVPRGGAVRGRLAGVPRTPPVGSSRFGQPRGPSLPPPTPSRVAQAPVSGPPPSPYAGLSREKKDNLKKLVEMGFLKLNRADVQAIGLTEKYASERKHAPTVLGGIFRALGVPENVGAGMLKGAGKEFKKKGSSLGEELERAGRFALKSGAIPTVGPLGQAAEKALPKQNTHALPPWTYIQATGAGFKEVPAAVKEGYTYENLLKENNNPNSFLFKHARPISLGLSIIADPTTYIGFGASTGAKQIASRSLAMHYADSLKEGKALIGTGVNPRTGRKYLEHEWPEAMMDAHAASGRPYSLGDALDAQKDIGAMGAFNPRGGLKFAGMSVPGTERVGRAMARGTRAGLEKAFYSESKLGKQYRTLAESLVPDAAARHIADDVLRASTLQLMDEFKAARMVDQDLIESIPNHLMTKPIDLADQQGIVSRTTLRDAMEIEDLQAMRDLHPSQYSPAQKALWARIRTMEGQRMSQYIKANPQNKNLRAELEFDRRNLHAKYDPLEATTRFQAQMALHKSYKEFKREILKDPRFAFRLTTKTEKGLAEAKQLGRRDLPPYNYVTVHSGTHRYAVAEGIGEALVRMDNPANRNIWVQRAFDAVNYPQNKWKIYATQPNPAFHTMNLLGAVWNNALLGIINPVDYARAWGTLMNSRLETRAAQGLRGSPAQAISTGQLGALVRPAKSTAKGKKARALVEEATKRGGLGRSSFVMAETEKATSAAQKAGLGPKPWELHKTPSDLTASSMPKTRTAIRRGRQAGAVGAAAAGALPVAAILAMPEAAKVGKVVGGTIEDWVRLTPFQKVGTSPQMRRYMEQMNEAFGPIRVPGLKHPGFTKQQQQAMYDIGAAMTKHFQFDYTNLTEFERQFAKTIFPFWTFYSRNMALQVAQVIKQPGKYAPVADVMNYSESEGIPDGPFKSLLPVYFDNLAAFQVPVPDSVRGTLGLPQDQPIYLNPKLPFATLNLVPQLWIPFTDDTPGSQWQKWNRALAPIFGQWGPYSTFGLKTITEVIVGKQLGLAKPIDYQRASSNDFRNSTQDAPDWVRYMPGPIKEWMGVYKNEHGAVRMPTTSAYFLETMTNPFITNFGSSVPNPGATPEEKGKVNANRVSWLTGVRLIPADLHKLGRSYAYGIKNELEAQKSELNERGEYPDRDWYRAKAEIDAAIDIFEAVELRNQHELYGPGGAP